MQCNQYASSESHSACAQVLHQSVQLEFPRSAHTGKQVEEKAAEMAAWQEWGGC